jgi:hypothetical protein
MLCRGEPKALSAAGVFFALSKRALDREKSIRRERKRFWREVFLSLVEDSFLARDEWLAE